MRVAVVLHERRGGWSRQLRPRLSVRPLRWFETRSLADLSAVLEGIACPLVLVDLARQPLDGLEAVEWVRQRARGALILVLDPDDRPEVVALAYELGATLVRSGFAPPPEVAGLIARWIEVACRRTESLGWSRTSFPESAAEPWSWLSSFLDEPSPTTETIMTMTEKMV